MSNYTIGFIGTGNMGGALVQAACKGIDPKQVLITNHTEGKARRLAEQVGCDVARCNTEIVRQCRFIMLGVKPQVLPGVLREIAPAVKDCMAAGEEKVLVSMAAGVTTESMEQHLGLDHVPLIRIMPNTPASIGKGMTLVSGEKASQEQVEQMKEILRMAGRFDDIPEKLNDAAGVTAGCTPAFTYMFIEALADGAVMAGVPRAKAMEYAAQAVMGAAALVLESGQHPGALKDAVCSPGGSTIVGVAKLEEGGLRSAAIQAILGAYRRNQELGK